MDISLERTICSIYPFSVRNRDFPPSIACNCALFKLGSESSCVRHSNIAYCNEFCILVAVCTLSADVCHSSYSIYIYCRQNFHFIIVIMHFAWYIFVRGEKKGLRFVVALPFNLYSV